MTLGQRLRDELHRSAPDTTADAPTVNEMTSTVASRRRRNRMASGIGAAVLAVGVIGGAAAVALPDNTSDVIATANNSESAEVGKTAPASDDAAAPIDDAPKQDKVQVETPADAETVEAAEVTEEAPVDDAPSEPTVTMQESAVEFAGGSGVLVTATETGFSGIASSFGGDAGVRAIGLTSDDGLNWTEVELSGIPDGATATALTRQEGVHVALFSMFDVDAQQNNVYVGTSVDLANWTLSDPLPGRPGEVVASSIAANPDGIVVVGMTPDPQVWTGPFDGPFEAVGTIDGAQTLAGVTATDSGFVGVGRSSNGMALFDSVDGAEWTSSPVAVVDDGEDVTAMSVAPDGSILLAGDSADGTWTLLSADGGQSWSRRAGMSATSVSNATSAAGGFGLLGVNADEDIVLTLGNGDDLAETTLNLPAGSNRVSLLAAGGDSIVLLSASEGGLTWIVAQR